jgi:hypothetical protein
MESFFNVVAHFAVMGLGQQTPSAGFTEDQMARLQTCDGTAQQIARCQAAIISEIDPRPRQVIKITPTPSEEYQGTTIFFVDDPTLRAMGFVPAYAVVDGVGIVATSPEEIHQLIDTEASGDDVRSAPVYTSATASVPTQESVFFLDVQAIAATVREQLPPDAQATYDRDVAPNLAPITAFVLGVESDEHHQTVRMLLQIAGAKE